MARGATWELDLGARVWTRGRARERLWAESALEEGGDPARAGRRRAVEQTVPAPRKHPLAVSVSETRGAPPPHPRPASAPRFAASGRAGRGEEWV